MNLFDMPTVDKAFIRRGFSAPIPETGWQRITEYPLHYKHAARIAYDVETRETDFEHGAGWGRGLGYVVGVSVAAHFHDGHIECKYFPVGHDIQKELNLPLADVVWFLKEVLETNIPKVGANLMYDYGWMTEIGVTPKGIHMDVQFAEALFSNDGLVNLEYLGKKYLGEGKDTDLLYDWITQTFPKTAKTKLRQHIWQSPVTLVGFYAEQDSILPLRILEKQWKLLVDNQLTDVFMMECATIPLLVEMRRAGATIDVDSTLQLRDQIETEIVTMKKHMCDTWGFVGSVNSGRDIAKVCDNLGLKYPLTKDGAPSFIKDWLKNQEHPFLKAVNELREREKIVSTFIDGHLLGSSINGKIHCAFHPMRSDEGGTRTGRYSSSDPNLQNIPSRGNLAPMIRKLFIPDHGHETMFVGDYSQIEYRMLAHFAVGRGADDVRARYNNDPKTDYHDMTIALVNDIVGMMIERKYIKNINFGLLYGMTKKRLARNLGLEVAEADKIFQAYHAGAPYVAATMAEAANEADENGFIRTILGRKGYFNDYVPVDDRFAAPLPFDAALRQWGYMIEKSKLYKAINYKIQGSAADGMKMAMYKGYTDGIFDVTGVPRLTVHDELVFSVAERTPIVEEAYRDFIHTAETCLALRVPLKFECDYGSNWSEAK